MQGAAGGGVRGNGAVVYHKKMDPVRFSISRIGRNRSSAEW